MPKPASSDDDGSVLGERACPCKSRARGRSSERPRAWRGSSGRAVDVSGEGEVDGHLLHRVARSLSAVWFVIMRVQEVVRQYHGHHQGQGESFFIVALFFIVLIFKGGRHTSPPFVLFQSIDVHGL